MIKYCLLLLSFSFSIDLPAQKHKITVLYEQMYFNVFERRPDAQILPFIKKYFPAFTTWKDENGPWAYQYKEKDYPLLDTTMHSFSFSKHPILKSTFKTGRLDLISHEKKDNKPLVAGWMLTFTFESEQDAQTRFDFLCKQFEAVSNSKLKFNRGQKQIAQYSNDPEINDTNCMELIMVQDDLQDNLYNIYFHNSRYYHP